MPIREEASLSPSIACTVLVYVCEKRSFEWKGELQYDPISVCFMPYDSHSHSLSYRSYTMRRRSGLRGVGESAAEVDWKGGEVKERGQLSSSRRVRWNS